MAPIRTGRQKYYDIFAHFYDSFIKMHSGTHQDETRKFLVNSCHLENTHEIRILDVCCGTGAVIQAFAERYPAAMAVGYDFSAGMLQKAKEKAAGLTLIQGDAAALAFKADSFDVVCCSHALYELKGQARYDTLQEMKRIIKPDGMVLLMEHEVPHHPVIKILFHMRMLTMGSTDAKEFLREDLSPFKKVFPNVAVTHSPSGKSKLIICRRI